MKDYFVKRIKHYYDGGKLETGNGETIQQEDVKQEVNETQKRTNSIFY